MEHAISLIKVKNKVISQVSRQRTIHIPYENSVTYPVTIWNICHDKSIYQMDKSVDLCYIYRNEIYATNHTSRRFLPCYSHDISKWLE